MKNYLNGFDYDAIHEKAKYVVKERKRLSPEALESYQNHFDTKCAGSKAQLELAKESIPHGIQHNLANNVPFPLSADKAEGAYIYDIDGNKYFDLLQAGGPTVLGNNYKIVRDKVLELIETKGPLIGIYSDYERLLAEEVKKHFPSVERFRMLSSGTEAGMLAIRLARAYTGKKNIIRIIGNYHGWSDIVYSNTDIQDSDGLVCGVLAESIQYTYAVPPNDIEALEKCFKKCESEGGVAAFILEGIGQDSGALPLTREYHKQVRQLCDKYSALFICDEVVTAFRLHMGGAQAYFNNAADISVFGKVIGGGYPGAGAIGGKAEIMDMLAGGLSKDRSKMVRVGGTLTANPLTCLAGLLTLQEIDRLDACDKLDKASDYLCRQLNDLANKYEIPALIFHQASILHIDLTGLQHLHTIMPTSDPAYKVQLSEALNATGEFAMALAAEGVIIAGGNKSFINLDTIPVIDDVIEAYERVFRNYK